MNVVATKLSLTLTVTDVAAEHERLRREGAFVTGRIHKEPWGEQGFRPLPLLVALDNAALAEAAAQGGVKGEAKGEATAKGITAVQDQFALANG